MAERNGKDNTMTHQPKTLQEQLEEARRTGVPDKSHYLRQFFTYGHLPPHLQAVSKPFGELAELIDLTLPLNSEKVVALRKLLEAKDCAVRALLWQQPLASHKAAEQDTSKPPPGPGFPPPDGP